jgi:hypothetical protein
MVAVPEPASMAIMGSGLAALGFIRRLHPPSPRQEIIQSVPVDKAAPSGAVFVCALEFTPSSV